jgi:hypothetical protein
MDTITRPILRRARKFDIVFVRLRNAQHQLVYVPYDVYIYLYKSYDSFPFSLFSSVFIIERHLLYLSDAVVKDNGSFVYPYYVEND